MGDSDESVFWDEREGVDEEEEYGGIFTSQDFHTNLPFETENQSVNYDDESNSKRVRLSPDSDHQEGDEDSSSQSNPLGLTLSKTPSFLNLLQKSLSKGKRHTDFSTPENDDINNYNNNKPRRKMDDMGSEKLKASNFPAFCLNIGSWQRITRHEGDLTAKLYYAKRKLVWEILDGALKSKIEVQWSDISAIRAFMPDNEPGSLEIELNQPPLFYREINPQPRKHTLWQQASDFTGGQAPVYRRHYVRFPPGVLDKHYEKLLQCDERLLALSQKPFPTHHSPYFDPTMYGISQLSLILNNTTTTTSTTSTYQSPYNSYPQNSTIPPFMEGTYHHYQQPNVGMLNDVDHRHLLGAVPSMTMSMSLPMDEHHYYGAYQLNQNNNDDNNNNNVISNDIGTEFNQNFAQPPQYWQLQPPQHDVSRLLMEQQQQMMMSNNSLPPTFGFPGDNVPTTGGYF